MQIKNSPASSDRSKVYYSASPSHSPATRKMPTTSPMLVLILILET